MSVRLLAPTPDHIALAARRLRAGGLVAFPTETVYGLGANALDAAAVARIFAAKGRPASNPVIVHVATTAAARALAARWPAIADVLASRHWPGPLTLVVEKTDAIPSLVCAGGSTVGLRVPAHPVALALLRASGVPIAAPSANRSQEISPTTAQHVVDSLGACVDDLIVLDGGPCPIGIESTVVDVSGERPVVLRPGRVVLPPALADGHAAPDPSGPARSPGQMARHYAPRKPLRIVARGEAPPTPRPGDVWLAWPVDAGEAAARLYAELRRLDADPRTERILVPEPPEGVEWSAIRDRLRRAAN